MDPLVALRLLAALWIIATLIPLWRHDGWWVRALDYPRVQIVVVGLGLVALYLALGGADGTVGWALLLALGLGLAFHGLRILPFTPWVAAEVASAETPPPGGGLSLLVANVFMENRRASALLEEIRRRSPDVVLTVETDDWWAERLRELAAAYPFTVEVPLDNTYGMLLHSRLELVDPQVKFLVDREIPSIHGGIRLINGRVVRLHLAHPKPPVPKESLETTERDGEFLIIGREVGHSDVPTVVAGDFNDVPWSFSTRLMRRISGLLDPRIGRGLYSTYHAGNPLLRWPLDQILLSRHFRLVRLERLPAFGSDHYPIFLEACLEAGASTESDDEPASPDVEIADEKIEAADPHDDLEDVRPERSPEETGGTPP